MNRFRQDRLSRCHIYHICIPHRLPVTKVRHRKPEVHYSGSQTAHYKAELETFFVMLVVVSVFMLYVKYAFLTGSYQYDIIACRRKLCNNLFEIENV